MKYAVVNTERRRIQRVTDETPQFVGEQMEVVEITDEQAAAIAASDTPSCLIDGEVKPLAWVIEIRRAEHAAIKLAELYVESPDAAKAAKIQELKQERDAAWQGDLTTSFGVPFHTDVQTQIDIQMMLQMLDPLEVFSGYKCADGVRRDLSREQFALALNEGVVRKVTSFAIEGAKLEAVEAATTVEELAAI